MASCIVKDSAEYQILLTRSGLSDFKVEAIGRMFMDKYGRLPYLDELPNPNSEPALKEFIKLKENGGTTVDELLEATQTNSVDEAIVDLNDSFRDLEVSAVDLGDEVVINVEHRPNKNNTSEKEIVEYDEDETPNSSVIINETVNKLAKLYGIQIIPITSEELNSPEWNGIINDARTTNAFVYNGNIYINTDVASIDAPIHEMLHLIFGSIRYQNPELYQQLVQLAENFKNYQTKAQLYKDRTQNDLDEEILISEMANYLAGNESELDELEKEVKHEIFYNMNRVLDTILMGNNSVNSIDQDELYQMSMSDIAKKVNSSLIKNQFYGSIDEATILRMASNRKTELMRSGELDQICS